MDPIVGGTVKVLRSVGGAATILLENPRRLNALPVDAWTRLPEIVRRLDADNSVRSIVLTGAGAHFSSGLDLTTLALADGGAAAAEIASVTAPAEAALIQATKPVIAKIRGYCIGGGVLLAAACDLRVVSADAVFAVTPAKLGIVYPRSSVNRLVQLVGPSFAKRLLFTADFISADRAYASGLVDDLVPERDLDEAVGILTSRIASLSRLSLAAAKAMIDEVDDSGARDWTMMSRTSGEQGEGVAAFLEGRQPAFPWRRS